MKKFQRIFSLVLAGVMMLTVSAGCSMPKIVIGGTAKTAGTVDNREISTGEYLAYMYTVHTEVFYTSGLYQYAQYGMDAWGQELTYGEGDNAQKVPVADYIRLATKDEIVNHAAMRQLMEKYNLTWDEKELKEVAEQFASMDEQTALALGFSKDNLLSAYKNVSLNYVTLLNGLYGKGGEREIAEADLKKYFDENYLSYKIITLSLTDSEGKELAADKKKEQTDKLNGYLEMYNKDKNFEAVVDKYNKDSADKNSTEKIEASKDEDNRRDADATDLDENLVKEIRKLEVGKAAVVEYKANGSTPTAALVLRLDPNGKKNLFSDSTEAIINKMKGDELDKEIDECAKSVAIDLKNSVIKKCDPKKFEAALG